MGFTNAGSRSSLQRLNPAAHGLAQPFQPDSVVILGETLDLFQPCFEQGARPAQVSAAVMMKPSGYLDHSLKKVFLGLRRREPEFFPRLVGLEKLAAIELLNSPLKFHIFHLRLLQDIFCALHHSACIIANAGSQSLPMEISVELPGAKLGIVEADDVRVETSRPELIVEVQAVCDRLRRELTVEQVAALPTIRAVREMFREWGIDPARYRPSSEALLRRVVQGKGLYYVANLVDIGNLGSIETGWPYGCYNRAAFSPPVHFRAGRAGETYEGIGKQTWHLAGRPVLADAQGPFGSPISDSTRTMITPETTAAIAVIYAPAGAPLDALEGALAAMTSRLERFATAQIVRTAVVAPVQSEG